MKIYYLQDTEIGWDNVVCMATTKQKLIENYTDGEVILKTEEEVNNWIEQRRTLYISYKFLYD